MQRINSKKGIKKSQKIKSKNEDDKLLKKKLTTIEDNNEGIEEKSYEI